VNPDPHPHSSRDSFHAAKYTPLRLFLERAAAFWKAIWGCWRTVLDWTVCLYIVLPGAFIAVGIYRDFMRDPPPGLSEFPLYPILAVLALLQLAGKYRTFAEPGDGLLLYRFPRWRRGFAFMGFLYGGTTRLTSTFAVAAILSPVLLPVFGLSATSLAALVLLFVAAGLFLMMARDRIALHWKGWRRWAALVPVRAGFVFAVASLASNGATNPLFSILTGTGFFIAAFLLLLWRQRKRGTLLHELAVEDENYIASVGWILKDTLEKKPMPARRKPILFAMSQPLLPHRNNDSDRLADSWMKAVLRRPDLLKQLAYFLGAGAAAVVLPPLGVAAIVWLVLPFLVSATLQLQWKQWLAEPFLSMFDWEENVEKEASRKAKTRLSMPLILLWAILIGIRAGLLFGGFAWLAVAAMPLAGYFWQRSVIELLSVFASARRKKE